MVNGKVTIGDKTYNFSGNTKSITYSEVIGDDGDGDANTDGIIFNNQKKVKQSTSATITSDFEGTFNAREYRQVETIKTDKNLTSDVEIIGNSKSNKISSGSGDDTIDGGRGDDKIDGGAGDDSIFGGLGADTLTGGKGYDIFVYDGKGQDKITDYTAGEDTVSIDGALKRASVSGNNVIFKVGTGTLTIDKAVGKKITFDDDTTKIFRAEGEYNED